MSGDNPHAPMDWQRDEMIVPRAEVERLRAEIERLKAALAFARSVIKSGEPWTDECERRLALESHRTWQSDQGPRPFASPPHRIPISGATASDIATVAHIGALDAATEPEEK
jgi:hypothetical protein